MTKILKGKKLVGGPAFEGEALVSPEPIAFYGCIDPETGIGVEPGHSLEGKNVTGKILVYPTGKGSTANCNYLFAMSDTGKAPMALIMEDPDPIQIVGAIMGKIPVLVCKEDPTANIHSGDRLRVDPETATIEIL